MGIKLIQAIFEARCWALETNIKPCRKKMLILKPSIEIIY